MSSLLQFENIDFDPNALFTLTYSFEGIKLLLTNITKNQQCIQDRIVLLEQQQQQQQQQVHKDEGNEYKTNTINMNNNNNNNTSTNTNTAMTTLIANTKLSDIEFRLIQLESKVKSIIEDNNTKYNNVDGNNLFEQIHFDIKKLTSQTYENTASINTFKDDIDKLKIKIEEYNIYDILKDAKVTNGSIDASKLLIQSLENKIFKKFSLLDDRIKKHDTDLLKHSSDLLTIQHLINTISSKSTSNTSELNALKQTTKSSLEHINSLITSQHKTFTKEISAIFEHINKHEDECSLNITSRSNNTNIKDNNNNNNLSNQLQLQSQTQLCGGNIYEKDLKKFKETLLKKYYDLEKKFIVFNSEIQLEPINKDIDLLKEQIITKATSQEVFNLNEHIQSFTNILNGYKEEENLMMEEYKKIKETSNNINRKLDLIQDQLLSMKVEGNNSNESLKYKINESKFDNYLQISHFNEYTKTHTKDIERIYKEIAEFKRYHNELTDIVKERASDSELKNLEEYLSSLIEELKDSFNKKFAGKLETNRNFKSVELQIKQVIEMYLKNKEKGNEWLIAKKPLNGYSCASCEAFIGELKDKGEYLPWNKVPGKDINEDKVFRVGNGFSRILNMLNIDKECNYKRKTIECTGVKTEGGNDNESSEKCKRKVIGSNNNGRHNRNKSLKGFGGEKGLPMLSKNDDGVMSTKDLYGTKMHFTEDEREFEQPKV